jgi:hypothetical protein
MNDKVSLHEKNNKNNECGTEYKINLNFYLSFDELDQTLAKILHGKRKRWLLI